MLQRINCSNKDPCWTTSIILFQLMTNFIFLLILYYQHFNTHLTLKTVLHLFTNRIKDTPLRIHGHHIHQNVITAVRRVSSSIQAIECVGECALIYIPPKVCLLCVGINRNKSNTHSHQTRSKWKAFYYGNCRECCQRLREFYQVDNVDKPLIIYSWTFKSP